MLRYMFLLFFHCSPYPATPARSVTRKRCIPIKQTWSANTSHLMIPTPCKGFASLICKLRVKRAILQQHAKEHSKASRPLLCSTKPPGASKTLRSPPATTVTDIQSCAVEDVKTYLLSFMVARQHSDMSAPAEPGTASSSVHRRPLAHQTKGVTGGSSSLCFTTSVTGSRSVRKPGAGEEVAGMQLPALQRRQAEASPLDSTLSTKMKAVSPEESFRWKLQGNRRNSFLPLPPRTKELRLALPRRRPRATGTLRRRCAARCPRRAAPPAPGRAAARPRAKNTAFLSGDEPGKPGKRAIGSLSGKKPS